MPSGAFHVTQDEGDENLTSPPADALTEAPDEVGASRSEQPARTTHLRQKSTHSVFGIQQRGTQVRGNDPFDYEQRFPEDKRYEELGPFARVWRTYLEECATYDVEMLEGWRDGLDVLLVFTGLFSAVVTTFVVQTSQSLQVNYNQVTVTLLFELINVQRASANGSLVNDVPRSNLTPFSDFRPTITDSLVNGLWFTSLSFSLTTALFTVLTKQWIHQYIAVPSGTPRDRGRVRHFRYMGLQQWGVGFIIGLLPVLLSVSLGLFLVGLVLFLSPLQVTIATVVGTIAFISFAAYFISNVLPIVYPSCPYKTPLSQHLFPLYAYILHDGFLSFFLLSPSSKSAPPIHTLRDAERSTVESSADEMDVHALAWLFDMSSNPSVKTIVVQSIGALPLASVKPLKQLAKGILEFYNTVTGVIHSPIEEDRFDRLARTGFCLGSTDYTFTTDMKQELKQLSPEVCAELLAIYPRDTLGDHLVDIRSLLDAQFSKPIDQRLHLQPIVWGSLLQKLLPFDSRWENGDDGRLIQPLFHAISLSYWHDNYKPLPLFLGNVKLEMCLTPDSVDGDNCGTCPVTLEVAIRKYLSPYVADAIFLCFRDTVDNAFHSDPVAEFPAPGDPRLRALLTMASSPFIHTVPMASPSVDTFFGMVMLNIAIFMGVHECDLLDDNSPSFKLDANRYSVLKLLYTLISSHEFGGAEMRSLDQRITLVTFLRVLNSTTPRPRFLPEDWCTPSMASNFVQIAFKDKIWRLQERDRRHRTRFSVKSESEELILYFLWFTPAVNQIFSHFVSGCHLDTIGQLCSDDLLSNGNLSAILDTFIVQMTPDVLDHRVFQQSLSHIFEPENLFTICTVYICQEKRHCLRRLAQVHSDNPAWPECLRKLDSIPEHFRVPCHDWGLNIRRIVSDFREFVEGGCMGTFGLDRPVLSPQRQAQAEAEQNTNESSLMKSLWCRLWRRQRSVAAHTEEIMMNSSSISQA